MPCCAPCHALCNAPCNAPHDAMRSAPRLLSRARLRFDSALTHASAMRVAQVLLISDGAITRTYADANAARSCCASCCVARVLMRCCVFNREIVRITRCVSHPRPFHAVRVLAGFAGPGIGSHCVTHRTNFTACFTVLCTLL